MAFGRLRHLALIILLLTCTATYAAETRTPTNGGIVYGTSDGQSLTMDYYAPKASGIHPIAIIIHGGGYQGGAARAAARPMWRTFSLPRVYAVFSVNYRLAPKYPYPYMVRDVQRAVRFIRYQAHDWSADPDKIALVGGSAGGYLSNMVGLLNAPGDPHAADPVERVSAKAQAVVSLYAQSSLEFVPLNADVHRFLNPFIAQKGEKEAIREASPIRYVSKADPPFLEILGDQDEYIPLSEATNLQTTLHAVGVRCDIIVIPGGKHGLANGTSYPVCLIGSAE